MSQSRSNNIDYDLSIPIKNGRVLNIQTNSVNVDEIKENLNNILKKRFN